MLLVICYWSTVIGYSKFLPLSTRRSLRKPLKIKSRVTQKKRQQSFVPGRLKTPLSPFGSVFRPCLSVANPSVCLSLRSLRLCVKQILPQSTQRSLRKPLKIKNRVTQKKRQQSFFPGRLKTPLSPFGSIFRPCLSVTHPSVCLSLRSLRLCVKQILPQSTPRSLRKPLKIKNRVTQKKRQQSFVPSRLKNPLSPFGSVFRPCLSVTHPSVCLSLRSLRLCVKQILPLSTRRSLRKPLKIKNRVTQKKRQQSLVPGRLKNPLSPFGSVFRPCLSVANPSVCFSLRLSVRHFLPQSTQRKTFSPYS